MDPSCLVLTVQAAGGVMVWGIFSWHTLGPLVPIEHRLKATAYLSIVADHVHPFMTTVYPSSDATSSRIMHHVTKLKSSQTGFLNMTMSSLSVGHSESRRMTDELGSRQRDLSTSSVTKRANGHWHAIIASSCR